MLSHIEMPDYNNPSDRTCTIRYHEVAETLHPDTKQPLWSWDYKWVPERLDPPDWDSVDQRKCRHPSQITQILNRVTGNGEISVGTNETSCTREHKEAGVTVKTSYETGGKGKEGERIHRLTEITSYNGWKNIWEATGGDDGVSMNEQVATEVTKADTAKTGPQRHAQLESIQ
jgi:hypothetical protein